MKEYHTPLVSAETLFANIGTDWVVVDCRHDLRDGEAGRRAYAEGHIPGAVHGHIDEDLSAPVGDGMHGRHPMPTPEKFVAWARSIGINSDTQVVAYDDYGGAWASRLWWLLRDYGHPHVALVDGGWRRWKELGLTQETNVAKVTPGNFAGVPGSMPRIDEARIEAELGQIRGAMQLVDARAAPRFRGDEEPVDPVAGHIPGAINLPFADNLGTDGLFLSPDELRAKYESALGLQEVGRVAVYCGSGVTAPHDILAMELADMGTASLYPGSWSAWCQPEAERPIALGP